MKYAHEYKLKKDLPKYKTGWPLRWSGNEKKFYPKKISTGYNAGEPDIYLDINHQGYTVEEITNTEWFEPVGKLVDFIPAFPTERNLEEYVYLTFETRLINDVDECRALNDLFDDKTFQKNLYRFVKSEYERHHQL